MRGRLRQRVILQEQTSTKDTMGARLNTWTNIATRPAKIEPLNGKEYFQNSGEHSEVSTRIRLRYDKRLSTLRTDNRVLHGAVIYNIKSIINPNERNRELILMCERDGN